MTAYAFEQTTMTLQFAVGTDEEGQMKYKPVTYRHIQATANAQQLQAVAVALASLSAYPLATVTRTDKQRIH